MKHFLILIIYTAPMNIIDEILPEHRAFLKTGYDQGILLMSGPENPRTRGVVVARSHSLEEIQRFFAQDPYAQKAAATHQFIEFSPVLHQGFLDDWVQG